MVVEEEPGIAAPGIIRCVAVEGRAAPLDQSETQVQLELQLVHDHHDMHTPLARYTSLSLIYMLCNTHYTRQYSGRVYVQLCG